MCGHRKAYGMAAVSGSGFPPLHLYFSVRYMTRISAESWVGGVMEIGGLRRKYLIGILGEG